MQTLSFSVTQIKKITADYFFNGFNIFEAYYAGFEIGRLVRIFIKLVFFFITLTIAKISMEGYLALI